MKRQIPLKLGSAFRSLGLVLAAVFLSQCAAPISVRTEKPVVPAGAPALRSSTKVLLGSIRESYLGIRRGDDSAIPIYNYSVARLVEEIERSGTDPWSAPITVGTGSDSFLLKGRSPAGTEPVHDQVFAADTLTFHGKEAESQSRVAGVGAPIVLVTSFEGLGHQEMRENLPLRNLTAIVRFEGRNATLELLDPYQAETVTLGNKSRPLAADYGAATMLGLSKARTDKLGLVRLLRPARYDDTAHLNFLQPYDPKRIPVLMVHGLDSTPATFAPLYFDLLKDPEIRKHYQFWVFSYPSGYPYPYSATLLRREMDNVKRDFSDHKNMVIIGHSMGSLISRLMVTDAGDKLWIAAFDEKPADTNIAGAGKDQLLRTLVFENRKEIDRAIFVSGPHRGSNLATSWIGRLGSRLVKLPGFLADTCSALLSAATADVAGLVIQSAPNSIGTLSPNNPFVVEVSKLPIAPGVTYHSLMGDRGKGDTPDSSDGVVAYWSSHLDGAASEKIVPSGHGAHAHPVGIAEIHRILKLHIKQRP